MECYHKNVLEHIFVMVAGWLHPSYGAAGNQNWPRPGYRISQETMERELGSLPRPPTDSPSHFLPVFFAAFLCVCITHRKAAKKNWQEKFLHLSKKNGVALRPTGYNFYIGYDSVYSVYILFSSCV